MIVRPPPAAAIFDIRMTLRQRSIAADRFSISASSRAISSCGSGSSSGGGQCPLLRFVCCGTAVRSAILGKLRNRS